MDWGSKQRRTSTQREGSVGGTQGRPAALPRAEFALALSSEMDKLLWLGSWQKVSGGQITPPHPFPKQFYRTSKNELFIVIETGELKAHVRDQAVRNCACGPRGRRRVSKGPMGSDGGQQQRPHEARNHFAKHLIVELLNISPVSSSFSSWKNQERI